MSTKINTIPPKRLSETITAAATSFKLNDILGFDSIALSSDIVGDVLYASFQNTTGTIVELMKIDPTTIASTSITILKRGLSFNEDGTETEVSGNKLQWIKNQTIVNLGTDTPAMYNNYVKVADAQTINGVKTFGSIPVLPASDPTTDNQATRKIYVDTGLGLKLDDTQLDTDATLAADSDTKIASQKATKAYALPKTGGTMTGTLILNTNTPSADLEAASKKYVDDTNNVGAADSSTTTKGIGKVSVAPASATDPIFVGDNDPRVPTQAENDALAGTGTPSSTNPYATKSSLRFGGTGTDGALTVSSGAFNIDLGGAATLTKNYTSISITGTGKVTFTNPHANGTIIVLKSQGNVTITTSANPAIDARGMGANFGSAGFGNSNLFFTSNSGTAGNNNNNATGGTGGAGGVLFSKNALYHKNVLLCVGGGGGNGGGYDGSGFTGWGGGGGGGGASAINSGTNGTNAGNIGGGNTSTSAPGGRGGGALYIECAGNYSCSSTLHAGGNNGTAATFSNGGGGAGGCIFILYNALISNTGTYTVAGGLGGTGAGGLGGNGGAGYSYVGLNTEFV